MFHPENLIWEQKQLSQKMWAADFLASLVSHVQKQTEDYFCV